MSLDQPSSFVKPQTLTHDAFLGGRLIVSQPRNGFRAGFDTVILGAAINGASKSVLDLGCGVGTAGLVALSYNPDALATLVDQNLEMLALAGQNSSENGYDDRVVTIGLDVIAKGSVRTEAGLIADHYESVISNPPFFDDSAGTLASNSGRASARHMEPSSVDLWVRTAAASAAPGGEVIFIYPAASLGALLASFEQRFGSITVLPLSPREGEPSSRILIRGIKGSRAPLSLLATRALHEQGTRDFRAEFDAIFRGQARLIW